MGQFGVLSGIRQSSESDRLVQLRRWVIIVTVLLETVRHFLWASLDGMPYEPYLSFLTFVLNPVFVHCMIENLSSATSRSVRPGLYLGCWMVYPFALMASIFDFNRDYSYLGYSFLGFAMHIMFGSAYGTVSSMGMPVADMYIRTTAWCSIGALVGGSLGYLLAKLVAGVRKILKRQLGG